MDPMKYKLITPAMHGLGDYAFAIALLTVPRLLNVNKKTVQLYRLIALEVLLYGTLSKYRFAVKPLIPLSIHRNIDIGNVAGMVLMNTCRRIRSNKQVLLFHMGMVGMALINVCFTDWKKEHPEVTRSVRNHN
jgi:hypothetical protein